MINDVVLIVVTGAVRELLVDEGEPVTRPLVAAVPVSSDAPDAVRLMGNRTSNLFTVLHVEIDDPVERLQEAHRVNVDGEGPPERARRRDDGAMGRVLTARRGTG